MLLPVAKRWGGGPLTPDLIRGEWWRGHSEAALGPSTMSLRAMVPLPTGYAGTEDLPYFTRSIRCAASSRIAAIS